LSTAVKAPNVFVTSRISTADIVVLPQRAGIYSLLLAFDSDEGAPGISLKLELTDNHRISNKEYRIGNKGQARNDSII
jgi:hypothetical protein